MQGEGLHRIPVGPVHAGIIEPGHFRFTANGETVVRLEQRLGYVHKGIESLMAGATIEKAAQLAGRTSGDSTVAYALAFAHAVEAALNIAVPPRAQYLRALMAELERLANHFGDIGAICNDASFSLMHAHCSILRERILRAADACFGHRLMMDRIVPGGVARDIAADGGMHVKDTLAEIRWRFPRLIELYDNTASLQDRTVKTGVVSAELVRQFGAGGYVGRASGRAFDARKAHAYAPYDRLEFEVPVLTAGDVNARVWVRIREVEQSLALVDQILARLPDGAIAVPVTAPAGASEGLGLVEGFRGDVLAWLRLDGSRVVRCHLRDPSWFQWPLLGSRDREQHRRRLSAVQQIFQLFVFGTRPLRRRHAQNIVRRFYAQPADRTAAVRGRRGAGRTGGEGRSRRAPTAGPQSLDPRRSMPAPATAANWKSMRSITPSTTSNVSACALSLRRATPTCSW